MQELAYIDMKKIHAHFGYYSWHLTISFCVNVERVFIWVQIPYFIVDVVTYDDSYEFSLCPFAYMV
jgi:hypothetical protein